MHSFKKDSNDVINTKLIFFSNNIINLANYFNHAIKLKSINNNYTLFFDNYNNAELEEIENIIHQKLSENQTFFNLTQIFQNTTNTTNILDIINIIRKSKVIITDNVIIVELAALSFTSCILYGNFTENNYINIILKLNLNYIKYIDDINELENQLIYFGNKSNEYNIYDIQRYFKNLILELNI